MLTTDKERFHKNFFVASMSRTIEDKKFRNGEQQYNNRVIERLFGWKAEAPSWNRKAHMLEPHRYERSKLRDENLIRGDEIETGGNWDMIGWKGVLINWGGK